MEIRTSVLCLLVTCCCCDVTAGRFDPTTVKPIGKPPPSPTINVTGLIEYYGYNSSEYTVETEDGYILPLVRMGTNPGPAVLFVSGMGISSDLWVCYGPYHSLPYVLHDLGYDIWIMGRRDTALNHKTLKITDPKYWDFSHDDHALYDIPSQLDVVVEKAGHSRLLYLGSSIGGSIFMALCSLKPEYCDLFIGNAQLVPAMYMPKESELSPAARFTWLITRALVISSKISGVNTYRVDVVTFRKANLCGPLQYFCFTYLNIINGFLPKHMYKGWLNYILSLGAVGISAKQLEHYLQMISTGGTPMFDYRFEENMKRYGQPKPPHHDLSKIKSPTLIIASHNDYYVPYSTLKKTAELIGNQTILYLHPDNSSSHGSVVIGKNAYKEYFSQIVDFFDSITGMKL